MSFNCYDSLGHKITTTSYLDCEPSLDITMTASEFAALKDAIANIGNSNLTVAELFAVPSVIDITNIFWLGFNYAVYFYVFAYLVGSVVIFISER